MDGRALGAEHNPQPNARHPPDALYTWYNRRGTKRILASLLLCNTSSFMGTLGHAYYQRKAEYSGQNSYSAQ